MKVVKLHIDEDNFPALFSIKNDELGDMVYKIFTLGYQTYFPHFDKITTQQTNNQHTDILRYDIDKIGQKLDRIDIQDKITHFYDIVDDLFGISNNVSKKGRLSEDLVYKIFKTKFKDYAFEETRGVPHSGDGILIIPRGKTVEKVMVEIKNYNKNVDTDEVNKLVYDMKYKEIKYAVILSLKSGFVGKKQMDIKEFYHNNTVYTIVFVPYVMDEISKIEASILLIERLMEYHNKTNKKTSELGWLEERIFSHLYQLDNMYNNYVDLKQKYNKMENSIKQCLHDYYLDMRSYETDLKTNINKIWMLVEEDFGKAEKELIKDNQMDKLMFNNKKSCKNFSLILEILVKYNYSVEQTDPTFYFILNCDKNVVGTISKTNKTVQLIMMKPRFDLTVDIKKNVAVELINLDTLLASCN
jgi:hypothetical protein